MLNENEDVRFYVLPGRGSYETFVSARKFCIRKKIIARWSFEDADWTLTRNGPDGFVLEPPNAASYDNRNPVSPPAETTTSTPPATPPPAIAPFDAAKAKEHQEAWAKHLGVEVETENSIGMKLRVIPPGTFMMGEDYGAHEVTLTKPLMFGTYEVTQDQYEEVMGVNPSSFKGAKNPVESVSWNEAVEFCKKLSELPEEQAAGNVYRLPTEAEWEFACRSGTTTRFHFANNISEIGQHGWFSENSNGQTQPVGSKHSSPWGLHDMHGNVWEWCKDGYGSYLRGPVTDPIGAVDARHVVARGGGFRDPSTKRGGSADRHYDSRSTEKGYLGFRVSLSLSGTQIDNSAGLPDMDPKADDTSTPPAAPSTTPQPAIAPFDAAKAQEHQEAWAKYLGVEVENENSIGMKFRVIPAGTFTMGSSDGSDREKPAHEVTITKPFLLGEHEVTQAQYERVMGINPSKFKGANKPVETVSWRDSMEFCRRLSELRAEKAAGRVYRLPTEAQWEYACRAGTTTMYSFGSDAAELSRHAWHYRNSDNQPHPVCSRQSNAWGLYDLYGNVFEWCQNRYRDYPSVSVNDPADAEITSAVVVRGGSWGKSSMSSSSRFPSGDAVRTSLGGFRVVCILKPKDSDTELAAFPPT